MRTIVHLSDLHFGRIDKDLLKALSAYVDDAKPDLLAVSGDLTQRARPEEFVAAREFLGRFKVPQIVVPGNHDVPLYNVYDRFARKLDNFRRYITSDPEPLYRDSEIAVLGINTARSFTFKGGRVNREQVQSIRDRLCGLGPKIVKVVVTHHPFDLPPRLTEANLVGRARMAMERLAACGADLFLAGHLHLFHIGYAAARYGFTGLTALILQAGTAASTRGRGEVNSFNVIRIQYPRMSIEHVTWNSALGGFTATAIEQFERSSEGWSKLLQVDRPA